MFNKHKELLHRLTQQKHAQQNESIQFTQTQKAEAHDKEQAAHPPTRVISDHVSNAEQH